MRINNNMMAMNTHRQLGVANDAGAKSMEKLSSGFRINRAGDDAAGLSISEKMRGQIRGLNQASANAQDSVSLIQTAEGALDETHAILQRMRELAVQSGNDTNVDIDRGAIQDEMNQLTEEIDRISETTEFNTQSLLDGSFKGKFQIGANAGQDVDLEIGKIDTASLGLTSTNSIETAGLKSGSDLKDGVYTVEDDDGTLNLIDINGNEVGTVNDDLDFTKADVQEDAIITVKDGDASIKNTIDGDATKLAPGTYEISGDNVIKDGKLVGDIAGDGDITITGKDGEDDLTVTASELGLEAAGYADGESFTINGADVSTRKTAEGSITAINDALEQVSEERSNLGAMQNRLEHTMKNLDNAAENLQSAEARIRDVDMAAEMMEQTKQNILQQASTAMLANANQSPQSVLQLLG